MKRATRYITGLLTASTLMVGLGAGTAQAEQKPPWTPPGDKVAAPAVPPAKTVSASMRLAFDDYKNWGGSCTLGAVGTDSAGRKVGITAGHCNPTHGTNHPLNLNKLDEHGFNPYPGVEKQTEVLDNNHPVWDWRDVAAGPIGWIRYVSNDDPDDTKVNIGTLDYMVIEFANNVTLSSQVMTAPKYGNNEDGTPFSIRFARDPSPTILVPSQPWYKMNQIYSDAAGNPSVMPPTGLFGRWICNAGSITSQQFAQNNDPTGVACGHIWYNENNWNYTGAETIQGDSGGPANPMGQSNKWAGIVSWMVGTAPSGPAVGYHVYTSPKAILDDLNPRRNAANQPITGSGFTITNN
ncbi:hypothetical protein C8K38_11095 [Rhodococcus sp. OK611]|jgi:hypothetical protein|uniref:hypothetical protein n=1 Tax=unclassified Rhodococcus (in: high G+C Gram-positive bacteria) TaxID=192944 RepID=UPI000BC5959A|nr:MULTISPECIES: hypothetical protein [unclassified Rhodococcus (in: high G+C Gram-positive bacteria)]PTR42798.1 hypothetical protein C8K38_11095 [Rhodococcus sp. OK611]SNX91845.1 hypothetical protein SAMN05447004_111132 [Rhodococcus sp. OK270]